MTDLKQKLQARMAEVKHWRDPRPFALCKRLLAQPVVGAGLCALDDTIVDELTNRPRGLGAPAHERPCGSAPICGAVTARSPNPSG